RLVGPGTFNEDHLTGQNTFIEMLGDVKAEVNTELRLNVYKFINTAVFVDAGNIWLFRDNPAFPGGTFSGNFYRELAVNWGLGLRFDFSILILRLDLGVSARKPWLPQGERWDFRLRPGDPTWRKENLYLNLAIGYPFYQPAHMHILRQHISDILSEYRGRIPLAHFLKAYFKSDARLGSRDRKAISAALYGYYRLSRFFPEV